MDNRYPRVTAYHLIITTYGFWLPNDPRGSWSRIVHSDSLVEFGSATKTDERHSVAHRAHDRAFRLAAKEALVRKPVRLNGLQARAVARGIAHSVERSKFIIYACAIMPDHVHFVVARHRYSIELVASQLKSNATSRLIEENMHPFSNQPYQDGTFPTPWARKNWSVFMSDPARIRSTIKYVNSNPIRIGFKPQSWSFITQYA